MPVDELNVLFTDNLANSDDFQDVYAKLFSEESQKRMKEVKALKEYQHIVAKLKEFGFELIKLNDFIYG